MRSWQKPGKLGEILEQALNKWEFAPKLRRYEVMEHWEEVVGEKIATKSRAKCLQGNILVIEVDHPAWVQELNLLKPMLLKKIAAQHRKAGIKDIRFVLK